MEVWARGRGGKLGGGEMDRRVQGRTVRKGWREGVGRNEIGKGRQGMGNRNGT